MGYTRAQVLAFIDKMAPLMMNEAKSRGYKICSTAIAQSIIEGAAGTSTLASKYHNHWGLKAGSSYKGKKVALKTKEEYVKGKLTTITDYFRAYDSDAAGVKGYYDFINTTRYRNLKTATSYKEYAERLKAHGYATSSTYVNTLCQTVLKYNLNKYDISLNGSKSTDSVNTQTINTKSIKQWYNRNFTVEKVKELQELLNKAGYSIVVDGIVGNYTIGAVMDFQKKNHLSIDGKAGNVTINKLRNVK